MSRLLRLGATIYGIFTVFAITHLPSTSTVVGADPITWPILLLALPAALFLLGFRRFAPLVRI